MAPYPVHSPDAPPIVPDTKRYSYTATGLLQYEGWANSASNPQPSQPVWAIKQYTYDGNNRLVLEQWANGSSQRTNVWDNCATLSYE
jgi:YD repeat-containing protein